VVVTVEDSVFSRCPFANEPRAYRAAMAGAVGAQCPNLNIIAVPPSDLADAMLQQRPQVVIGRELTAEIELHVPAWLVLGAGGEASAEAGTSGQHTYANDADLAGVVADVDRAIVATLDEPPHPTRCRSTHPPGTAKWEARQTRRVDHDDVER
jgi:hypothetical protein